MSTERGVSLTFATLGTFARSAMSSACRFVARSTSRFA